MGAARSPGARLRSMWERHSRIPGGKGVFSTLLGWTVPYSGSIGATVVELRPGFARIEMRDRRRVRNHLQSIHAIALVNLAELSTGLALNVGLPDDARGILKSIRIDYLKKARGKITAEGTCELPLTSDEADIEVVTELTDIAGDVVARAVALWLVGPSKRPS
jgi:acyl-coenzyme A thioesterase PaaI-like protein